MPKQAFKMTKSSALKHKKLAFKKPKNGIQKAKHVS